ncbi:hypothetical protein F4678DRAFT_456868 [Xylaria arbuscula]|nr:hypothetical protein F4678DRAFT_456868 [Xylaria arbuscula]
MSTEAKDGSAAMVMAQWREASAQIDNHCRIIKLDLETLNRLGIRGEAYFVYHCSLLLAKPAEFVHDNSNEEIVYLGNADDMEKGMNSVVVRNSDKRFPVLCQHEAPKEPRGMMKLPSLSSIVLWF